MPQASITINAVPGSNDDLPINVLVQLNNQNNGGEVSFKWTILDQPPGTVDNLSSTAVQNPTFTPKKEGTYLIRLIVNEGLPTEQQQTVIAAIRQLKTRERIPAAGETTEDDAADGWATALNSVLRRIDALLADPGVLVGVNSTGGNLARGKVVRNTSNVTLKAGLPGQETVPGFTLATSLTLGEVDELLCVVEGNLDGTTPVANGALMKVRYIGRFSSVAGGPPSVGDLVYVNDTGDLSLVQGTVRRRVGSAINAANPYDVWFNGVGGTDIDQTPIDRVYVVHGPPGTLPNAERVDGTNASGLTTPFRVKAGNIGTVPFQVQGFLGGSDLTQWLSSAGATLAKVTNAGTLDFSAGGAVNFPSGGSVAWAHFSLTEQDATHFRVVHGAGGQFLVALTAGLGAGIAFDDGVIGAQISLTTGLLGFNSGASETFDFSNANLGTTVQINGTTGNVDLFQGQKITGMGDPTAANDAVNKQYADNQNSPVNYVLNGRFDIWQRGTSFVPGSSTWTITADRWGAYTTSLNLTTVSRQAAPTVAGQPSFARYALKAQRPAADTDVVSRDVVQEVPRDFVRLLRGRKVRVTAWVKAGANFSGTLNFAMSSGSGNDTDRYEGGGYFSAVAVLPATNTGVTGAWQQVSFVSAVIVPHDAKTLALIVRHNPAGTAGADDSYQITGVMLTRETDASGNRAAGIPGDTFIYSGGSPEEDYRHCLRYFEKTYEVDTAPGAVTALGRFQGNVVNTPTPNGVLWHGTQPRFKVSKWQVPTVALWADDGTANQWIVGVGLSASSASNVSREGFEVANATGGTVTPTLGDLRGHYTADAEI